MEAFTERFYRLDAENSLIKSIFLLEQFQALDDACGTIAMVFQSTIHHNETPIYY